MRVQAPEKKSAVIMKPKIFPVPADEQTRRIHVAVARRAYEIFLQRARQGGQELDDWRRAESELLAPLCCGLMHFGDVLYIEGDPAMDAGTIEVWVAPRCITVYGKPWRSGVPGFAEERAAQREQQIRFRILDLPLDIEPSTATARFRGPSLEMRFTTAQCRAPLVSKVAA